ncbi:MAG: alkaline phosphatase family protein, partial [Nevskiaceae bacterium]
ALAEADVQMGRLVDALMAAGRWGSTVLIVLSDHGMDYSPAGPTNAISTQGTLDGLAACFEPMQAVASGGSELIYVLDRAAPLADRQAALRAARACLLGTEDCATLCPGTTPPLSLGSIETAWYNVDDPLDAAGNMPANVRSQHPVAGDLLLSAADGGKFAEPDQSSANGQIPGNHGHPVTFHNTFLVTGGSPWVKQGQSIAPSTAPPDPLTTDWYLTRLPEQAETIDVAPTVAWLLGLAIADADFPDFAAQGQGFDGRVLKEAFTQFDADPDAAPPTACGRFD